MAGEGHDCICLEATNVPWRLEWCRSCSQFQGVGCGVLLWTAVQTPEQTGYTHSPDLLELQGEERLNIKRAQEH